MCLAILRTDKRFSNVLPRHPRGGPDGGRDIDAVFEDRQTAFGAVGFVNQANDSDEQKKAIRKKFKDDFKSALSANPKPEVFVFLTNINLTRGEKIDLIALAKGAGFAYCEIFDRERLRVVLDSVDGFSIRYQYLGLPLSEAEQASFFAKWGDDIQRVISTGFQRVETTLDRLQFLAEASGALTTLTMVFELDRTYSAEEIGHFRAFCCMFLREPKSGIWSILFGSSDKSNRMMTNILEGDLASEPPGIKHGLSGGAWEHYWDPKNADPQSENEAEDRSDEKYLRVGSSSSIGIDSVERITIAYSHSSAGLFSRLTLQDIDRSMFIFSVNNSLAEKIECIQIFANGYKLRDISRSEFTIDTGQCEPDIPVKFSGAEVLDQWVRIRPVNASNFSMSFSTQTPKRVFTPREVPS